MRKLIPFILILLFILSANSLAADESLWDGFRAIVQGYRNVTALVEGALTLVNTYNPVPGTAVHIQSGLGAADFDELAIKLSDSGGIYTYLLEVWTKRGAFWMKAMEYAYDDASSGQIVFSPYAFDSSYSSGSLHKIVFCHSSSTRQMTVYSQHSPAVSSVTASIGLGREQGGYVDLYFSAHLDTSFGGTGSDDAYLFGARIEKASPHRCTAKQGLRDQGDAYDFTVFGAANPANVGHFEETGFIADGQSTDGSYPAASNVDPANLPTSAEVSAVSVSFQATTDPDFI